jgi:hypothetical protein
MFKSWLGLIFVGSRWARALYFVLGFLRAWKTLIDKLGLSHSCGQALLNNKKIELNPKHDRPLLKCCAAHNRERAIAVYQFRFLGRRGVYEGILWLSFAQKTILRSLWMLSQPKYRRSRVWNRWSTTSVANWSGRPDWNNFFAFWVFFKLF